MNHGVKMNWLVLRGLARHQKHWGRFPEQLQKRLGGRVVCLDSPGFGTESHKNSPMTVKGITSDLRNRWVQQGETGKWGIFGHSLGGMIAVDWVNRYPKDFEAVAVMNSSFRGLSPVWKRLRREAFAFLVQIAAAKGSLKKEEAILKMVTQKGADHPETLESWLGIERAQPSSLKNAVIQILAASRFRAPSHLEIPMLVLSGAGDQMVNSTCSHQLAEHFGAELRMHPSAGHDIALDDPEWLIEHLVHFTHQLEPRQNLGL